MIKPTPADVQGPGARGGLGQTLVTVIVVPRERFGVAQRSLESLYRETRFPFHLIYVDGGSPPKVAEFLRAQSKTHGFHLVREERFLAPNEARNIGLRQAQTRYVVFMDNDVLVTPGWLEALVRCAEDTQADLVGPLYGVGEPPREFVHMAGGMAHIEGAANRRRLVESHRFAGCRLDEIPSALPREETELIEFHCLLARTSTLQALGPLDERLLSSGEHIDLCLAVRERGGTVYFEPASRISYVPPPPLDRSDLPFFRLRWSEAWTRASFARFREKWRLAEDDPYFSEHLRWLRSHRRLPLLPIQRALQRGLGPSLSRWPQIGLALLEAALNKSLIRDPSRLSRVPRREG